MSSCPALSRSPTPSVPAAALPHPRLRCCRLHLRPSSRAVARRATARHQLQPQPHLVALHSTPPPLVAGAALAGDAETGLAVLLLVLAAVMTISLSLMIVSFSAHRAIKKLELAANKLARTVAEEVPGTLSSLKLSFLEMNDLTVQLQKLRKMLTVSSRSGKKS